MSRRRPATTDTRRTSTPARTRRLTAVAVAPVAALALVGCSATNPILTQDEYDASDGLSVSIGDVRGINLLVVADEEGGPGTLVGSLTNDGSEQSVVTLQLVPDAEADGAASATTPVTVEAGETVFFGTPEGESVEFDVVPARPGGLVGLTLQARSGAQVERRVPVLDGSAVPEYASLVPTAAPEE